MCIPAHFISRQQINPKEPHLSTINQVIISGPSSWLWVSRCFQWVIDFRMPLSLGSSLRVIPVGATLRSISLRTTCVIVLSPSYFWAASVANSQGSCVWVFCFLWKLLASIVCPFQVSKGETSHVFSFAFEEAILSSCYFSNQFFSWIHTHSALPLSPLPPYSLHTQTPFCHLW